MLPLRWTPPRTDASSRLLAALHLTSALLLAASCHSREGTAHADDYVGGGVCASCHAREDSLWRGSDHELAMQPATSSTVLGRFDSTIFAYAGVTSTFYRRGNEFFVRTDGPDGALADFAIAYTFGARPLQQYLIPFSRGRYQALGVAWDTRSVQDGGQRWFPLYPDQAVLAGDELHWTGPNQRWNYMCAECHSTNLLKGYDLASDTYRTTWVELNVACEACHGPGADHVRWAEARAAARDDGMDPHLLAPFTDRRGVAWVFDAETGIASRRGPPSEHKEVEACARCHSRRSQIAPYRYGRPLTDTHRPVLLDEPLYYADGQIRDEVYVYGSFLQSRMYGAGVTCSDCHDPHSLALRAEGNAVCATCHLPSRFDVRSHHFHDPAGPGGQCVACHAPTRNYMVVDPRRDHSFRVPRPDLSATIGSPNACTTCHADRGSEWAASAAARWYGRGAVTHYGEVLHAARTHAPGADLQLAQLASDTATAAIVRATALSELAAYGPQTVDGVIESGLEHPDPLVRMGALDAAQALDIPETIRLVWPRLADSLLAVRIAAARVAAGVPDALLDEAQRAERAVAIEEYRQAQLVNAERPESHLNIGVVETLLERYQDAEREYETGLRLDPHFEALYVNLADLYRILDRDADGERVLRDGLAVSPHSAALYHALGLTLVRQRRQRDGLEALGRAADLAPESARYAYVLAVALTEWGRADSAERVVATALDRHPRDPDLLALRQQLDERR